MKIALALLVSALFCTSPLTRMTQGAEDKSSPHDEMMTYYFVMLPRGPKWTPEKTAETEKIQAGHMANIGKMHEAGKLSVTGPFTDDGVWRGIFILKASSMEEAKALVGADPAVQAGRLAVEVHPWMTKKGVLP